MSDHTEQVQRPAGKILLSGAGVSTFAKVWVALLAMTAMEVLLAYEQVPAVIMLTVLLGLSIVKAALIVAYFMHLKFERLSLFLTLFPMLIICIVLMLFFLGDAVRIPHMRPTI